MTETVTFAHIGMKKIIVYKKACYTTCLTFRILV